LSVIVADGDSVVCGGLVVPRAGLAVAQGPFEILQLARHLVLVLAVEAVEAR